MLFKNFLFLYLIILVWVIAACATKLYIPAIPDSVESGISVENLTRGRSLYVKNCSDCHTLYLPEKRTSAKWELVFPKMQKKAKVSDNDMELIKGYVLAKCKKAE